MSRIISGYDIDEQHVADVLESLAFDVAGGNAMITFAADGYEIDPEESVTYSVELDFTFTDDANFPQHLIDND